jgi:seryl-tRNA synthetase
MRKSKKNRAIKNKTIKKGRTCIYTDEAKRLIKAIKQFTLKHETSNGFTKTVKRK